MLKRNLGSGVVSDPNRDYLHGLLRCIPWYLNSSALIKKEIINLGNEYNGFIIDLISKQNDYGSDEVLKITNLTKSKSMIIPTFLIRSKYTNKTSELEYVSWTEGKSLNGRGIVLIYNKEILHSVAFKKNSRLGTGEIDYEAINAYYPNFSNGKPFYLPANVEKSLKIKLGLDQISFKNYIDLGLMTPDSTMTNNKLSLFALRLDFDGDMVGLKERNDDVTIFPISKVNELINKTNDSSLLAILAKLLSLKILKFYNE